MMTLKEICERYGVGASTVSKWLKDESFPKKAVKKEGRSNTFDTTKVDAWLKKRPDLTAAELLWKRYLIVDLLDNARDLLEDDPANASLFLHDAVRAMVDHAFLAVNRNLPRVKESITVLEQEQPAIGKLLRSYYEADHHQLRFSVAEQIAVQLLGTAEFFEWETEPEQFPDI